MRISLLIFLLLGVGFVNFGQSNRKVVVLDMTSRNAETNLSRFYGTIQMMDLTGISYDTTSDLNQAFNYPVIVTAARVFDGAFTNAELGDLETWVDNGGVFITSNLREPDLAFMAGIDTIFSDDELYRITWDTAYNNYLFRQIDDSLEVTISLGRESSGPTFFTRYYSLDNGIALGKYENDYAALAYNQFGNGHVYTFGPDFRDLIYRPRINQDINAHRTYSNGFEPSSDVIVFIMRNILMKHIPNSVYKYPVPGNYSSLVCITHDIDSRTAVDTMANFANSEYDRNIIAQYNLTVRYTADAWMTAFYLGAHNEYEYVKSKGHTLASHSVGHFPDFADASVFPFGSIGNDTSNYKPVYFSGMTIGGSVLGETEVSKNLIEYDFQVPVKSWRSGHLAFPDSLSLALEMLDYEFNSTYSSNDILTNFPYYESKTQSFSGVRSSILEIPMTISDVFASDPISESNYMDKVGIWSDVTRRYDRNNSSVIILIHPNRNWKLTAQEAFLDSLSEEQGVWAFEDYGRFWRKRDSLMFYSELDGLNNILSVYFENELGEFQSFIVDTLNVEQVMFYDQFNSIVDFSSQTFDGSLKLFYQQDLLSLSLDPILEQKSIWLQVFPNPSSGNITLMADNNNPIQEISLFDLSGKLLLKMSGLHYFQQTIDLESSGILTGMYVLDVVTAEGRIQSKLSLVID